MQLPCSKYARYSTACGLISNNCHSTDCDVAPIKPTYAFYMQVKPFALTPQVITKAEMALRG